MNDNNMNNNNNYFDSVIYDSIDEFDLGSFVAVGGESIVFKGIKISVNRAYALKFRSKDNFDDFLDYELKTLSRLEQCSTSKLAGFIPNVPPEVMEEVYERIPKNKRNRDVCKPLTDPNPKFFCIIEDFIPGCDMKEYCKGDTAKNIEAHTPPIDASYEQVVAFQRKLFSWALQFCEIMTHVTDDYKFLHLDIKPDNIMISNETESITVIDFGKSIEIDESDKVNLYDIYVREGKVYGTNGYAAPECCDSPEARAGLNVDSDGELDVRSDIFSFGAALWDCINPQDNLHIKFVEDGYFRRDLFNTPQGYTPELEHIIMKCTEKNPDDRYQNYDQLKAAVVYAEKKLLEREKPQKNLITLCVVLATLVLALAASFAINMRRESLGFEIAKKNFNEIFEEYKAENSLDNFKTVSAALLKEDPDNRESYNEILKVPCNDDGMISKDEANALLGFLENAPDDKIKEEYVNTIMMKAKTYDNIGNKSDNAKNNSVDDAKNISEAIHSNKNIKDINCVGKEIAEIIFNFYEKDENKKSENLVKVYEFLDDKSETYSDDYSAPILWICKELSDDPNYIKKIAKSKNISEEQVSNNLKNTQDKLTKNIDQTQKSNSDNGKLEEES